MENQCPNCHNELASEGHFCSVCGQRNEPVLITTRQLVADLFTNVFAWDNRFFRSIRELARPASLTIQFFAGARQQYIPPARLYLFTVLLHLAVISTFSTDSFFNISDSDRNSGKELVKLHDQIAAIHSIQDTLQIKDTLSAVHQMALNRLSQRLESRYASMNDSISFFIFSENPLSSFTLYDLETISLDSLKTRLSHLPWHSRLIGSQFVKTYRNPKELGAFLFARLSWMMFLILPFAGLILAGLYYRQKRYFVEHLVFALHYHVAAFLLVSLGLIGDYFINNGWSPLAFLLSLAYIFVAMKRYYNQSWIRTFGKFIALHLFYLIACMALTSILLIISFLFFA